MSQSTNPNPDAGDAKNNNILASELKPEADKGSKTTNASNKNSKYRDESNRDEEAQNNNILASELKPEADKDTTPANVSVRNPKDSKESK